MSSTCKASSLSSGTFGNSAFGAIAFGTACDFGLGGQYAGEFDFTAVGRSSCDEPGGLGREGEGVSIL